MGTTQGIRNQLSTLVIEAHKIACALDIGDERTEVFELCEALRRLQRQDVAGEVLSATNPLLAPPYYDEDQEEDEDDRYNWQPAMSWLLGVNALPRYPFYPPV